MLVESKSKELGDLTDERLSLHRIRLIELDLTNEEIIPCQALYDGYDEEVSKYDKKQKGKEKASDVEEDVLHKKRSLDEVEDEVEQGPSKRPNLTQQATDKELDLVKTDSNNSASSNLDIKHNPDIKQEPLSTPTEFILSKLEDDHSPIYDDGGD